MVKITVNCSSIYNIDFSCALFYKIEHNYLPLLIFLNDKVNISKIKGNRKYISRLSIPSFKWEKDKENCWKLIHTPIEELTSLSEFLNAVEDVVTTISNFSNFPKSSSNVTIKTYQIIKKELIYKFQNTTYSSLDAYKFLIYIIIKNVLKSKENIYFEYYSNLSEELSNYRKQNKTLLKIYEGANAISSKSIIFKKGGKISFKCNDKWIDYNGARINHSNLQLFSTLHSNKTNIPISAIQSKSHKFNIKFRGPLELLFFMQFGLIADLAYYIPAKFIGISSKNAEYITPISVADINRVSKKSGGKGFRLNPSGYSLLDYNKVDNLLNIIRNVYGCDSIKWDDLDEWYELINNYPRSDEKVSENQNAIRKIISEKEKKLRLDYRSGVNLGLFNIMESNHNNTKLGLELISLSAFLNHLKETLSPYTNLYFHKNLKGFLINQNLIVGNKFNTSALLEYIIKVCNITIQLLKRNGLDESSILKIENYLNEKRNNLNNLGYFDLDIKNDSHYKEYSQLNSINKVLKQIIEEYYTFTIFFLSSVLKANIFTSSLCLGFNSYTESIKDILNLRKENRCLYYEPIFFEQYG